MKADAISSKPPYHTFTKAAFMIILKRRGKRRWKTLVEIEEASWRMSRCSNAIYPGEVVTWRYYFRARQSLQANLNNSFNFYIALPTNYAILADRFQTDLTSFQNDTDRILKQKTKDYIVHPNKSQKEA